MIESDLKRSKKTCYQLDQAKGFTEPVETWFWPDNNKDEENICLISIMASFIGRNEIKLDK